MCGPTSDDESRTHNDHTRSETDERDDRTYLDYEIAYRASGCTGPPRRAEHHKPRDGTAPPDRRPDARLTATAERADVASVGHAMMDDVAAHTSHPRRARRRARRARCRWLGGGDPTGGRPAVHRACCSPATPASARPDC